MLKKVSIVLVLITIFSACSTGENNPESSTNEIDTKSDLDTSLNWSHFDQLKNEAFFEDMIVAMGVITNVESNPVFLQIPHLEETSKDPMGVVDVVFLKDTGRVLALGFGSELGWQAVLVLDYDVETGEANRSNVLPIGAVFRFGELNGTEIEIFGEWENKPETLKEAYNYILKYNLETKQLVEIESSLVE